MIGINTAFFRSDAGTRQGNVAQDVSLLRGFLAEKGIAFVADEQACAPPVVAAAPPPPKASGTTPPQPVAPQPASAPPAAAPVIPPAEAPKP